MQKETLELMYRFISQYPQINFLFFPLEDWEFFNRFQDGVPVYVNGSKQVINQYALVHFDGPHTTDIVLGETMFFIDKIPVGGALVYDDVTHFYDHNKIDDYLKKNRWKPLTETNVKISYIKA
jgi:hypothetical protein